MENDDLVEVGLGYILCWAGGRRGCRLLLTANTIQTVLKRFIIMPVIIVSDLVLVNTGPLKFL